MTFLELMATLGLDASKYDQGLNDAEGRAQSSGSIIGHGLAMAGAAAGAAIGAAVVGVTRLTVASVQAYGEYEQLVGGVEKIFGDSADVVSAYADNAYMTAGLSANAYMETVTSFSASLLQGLGGDTEAAAEIANQALIDMSDNANTYGTDMESIQDAYMGFSKDNFTMLDNLKLGYGGTREEMIRLINDSGILEEEITSLDNISFDQIIEAIHAVQEQTNIAGTTANEAASTVQGSIGMLQGAWQNLVIGLGSGNADLSTLINNVVESARTALGNILPVATQALSGIARLVGEVAPMVAGELPGLIDQILPPLLSAAVQIVDALVSALPTILSAISGVLPDLLNTLIPTILSMVPQLIIVGGELLMGLMQGTMDSADILMSAIADIIFMMANEIMTPDNISSFVEMTTQMILIVSEAILENAPLILASAVMIIANVVTALAESLPDILNQIITFIVHLGDQLGQYLWDVYGDQLVIVAQGMQGIWNNIVGSVENIKTSISDAFIAITDWVTNGIDGWVSFFEDGFNNIWSVVTGILNNVLGTFSSIFDNIKGVVSGGIQVLIDLFDFDWSLPNIALPHFNIQGGEVPWGIGGQGTIPSISVDWYAKAYGQPYLLDGATIFGAMGGKMLGGGEGSGKELIVGWDELMKRIDDHASPIIHVHVNIGETEIEDFMVDVKQNTDFLSGGRA